MLRGRLRRHLRRHRRQQQVEQALLRVQLGLVGDIFQLLLAHHVDGDFDQVANHGLDVAADIADLGELRSFDFHEGRIRQLRQSARDLRLAHAGGAHHDDVLRNDLFGQLGRQLLAAHAVAQRDGDGALGLVLADHVFVEFTNDLAGSKLVECDVLFIGGCGKINSHNSVVGSQLPVAVLSFSCLFLGRLHYYWQLLSYSSSIVNLSLV